MVTLPSRARLAAGFLLSLPAVVWTGELLAGTPPLILAGAAGPALLLAAAIAAAGRRIGVPRPALAGSLAWGVAVAAWLSATGNELARPWIDAVSNGDDRTLTALAVAPLLEEAAKFLGLVLMARFARGCVRDTQGGIVCGALVGVGFVFTENLLYLGISMLQGGEPALVRALYLRGVVGTATHAVFSATAGAGLGWFAGQDGRRRWLVPLLGFLFAHLQHLAWNALAAPAIASALCGADGGACRDVPTKFAVFGEATGIALCFLAPGLTFLVVAWRRASRCSGIAGTSA